MTSKENLKLAQSQFDVFCKRVRNTFDGEKSYYGIDFRAMFDDFEIIIDDLADASQRVYDDLSE